MQIKIALPKGRLLRKTSALFQKAEWELDEYHEQARLYHFKSRRFPDLAGKMFHEKDIPIQVAVGNYDLGICGLDWIEELLAKYPSSAIVNIKNLGYGEGILYVAASLSGVPGVERVKAMTGVTRIASEYPHLAEAFALKSRLGRFNIFPVWGGAEVYPPEGADLILVSVKAEAELGSYGMVPVCKILDYGAFLIANRNSWESKNLGEVVDSICSKLPAVEKHSPPGDAVLTTGTYASKEASQDAVRLALPDGHQQLPTAQLLDKAGIKVDDYPSAAGNRRPVVNMEGVVAKVIRPQDMPLQVANGNFDLAITGRDWLADHLFQFPSSPVKELLDLKFGKVKLVAVVSQELSANDARGLSTLSAGRPVPLRIASEYVNIADRYARDNHLGLYRVIPTWGATEAFLPDDADLLIENTETGRTIARHKLKIIDTIFESTARLVGSTGGKRSPVKRERMEFIVKSLRTAVEADN